MRQRRWLLAAKCFYLLFSAFLFISGIILIANKDMTWIQITNGTGLILILFGSVKIWGSFAKDLYRLTFQHGMATGILAASIGVFLLSVKTVRPDTLCTILGLTFLTDALSKIELSLDAHTFGISSWWLILGAGILNGVLSFLLLPLPRRTSLLMIRGIGTVMLTGGGLNILTTLLTFRAPSKKHPKDAVLNEESPWGL
ncbi:MAG TPA: hypothetical protein DCM49_05185 [Lachnospiraceae bacterium]|nr:hypothetical protein [Lachnospiraceae bacterium]